MSDIVILPSLRLLGYAQNGTIVHVWGCTGTIPASRTRTQPLLLKCCVAEICTTAL